MPIKRTEANSIANCRIRFSCIAGIIPFHMSTHRPIKRMLPIVPQPIGSLNSSAPTKTEAPTIMIIVPMVRPVS